MHQRGADAVALMRGQHPDRTERQDRPAVEGGPGKADVSEYLAVDIGDRDSAGTQASEARSAATRGPSIGSPPSGACSAKAAR